MSNRLHGRLTIHGSKTIASSHEFTLVVEPWAEEYIIHPEDEVALIAVGKYSSGWFAVSQSRDHLLVWPEFDSPIYYQFWRNGVLEDESNNPS
ncbi:MAG: hypothetical protein ACR2NU_00385 [Aeoliella sp.]